MGRRQQFQNTVVRYVHPDLSASFMSDKKVVIQKISTSYVEIHWSSEEWGLDLYSVSPPTSPRSLPSKYWFYETFPGRSYSGKRPSTSPFLEWFCTLCSV